MKTAIIIFAIFLYLLFSLVPYETDTLPSHLDREEKVEYTEPQDQQYLFEYN